MVGLDDEENTFIDQIFGTSAKVMYEVFLERTVKASWFFVATELRSRAWKEANVPLRHIEN